MRTDPVNGVAEGYNWKAFKYIAAAVFVIFSILGIILCYVSTMDLVNRVDAIVDRVESIEAELDDIKIKLGMIPVAEENHMNEPIPMLDFNMMYEMVINIEELNDDGVQAVALAWNNRQEKMQVGLSPWFDQDHIMFVTFDLDAWTHLVAYFQCSSYSHTWELYRWNIIEDEIYPDQIGGDYYVEN